MTDSTVTVKGTYLFQDYLAAHRLNRRSLRIALRAFAIIAGCIVVALELSLGNPVKPHSVLAGALLLIWGCYLSGLVFTLQVRRRWSQYPALRKGAVEMALSADGITSSDDEGNPVVSKWENFTKWREDSTTFLMYMSPHLWLSIPKRLLHREEIETVKEILGTCIGTTTTGGSH